MRLSEFFHMLQTKDLEGDKELLTHIDAEKEHKNIIEGRKLYRKRKEPKLFDFD